MIKNVKNNKGFTLVELIVVIVILAILAAILVPALLGYIDRARHQKGIQKMHDIQVAATASLAEYYGLHKGKKDYILNPRSYTLRSGDKVTGYNITNFTFSKLQTDGSSGNPAPDAIASSMLNYLASHKGAADNIYTFENYNSSAYGKTAAEVAKSGAEGLIIIIDQEYKIAMIQYSDLDGCLYTYEAGTEAIDVDPKGKFIAGGK